MMTMMMWFCCLQERMFLNYTNYVFSFIFFVEMSIKVIVHYTFLSCTYCCMRLSRGKALCPVKLTRPVLLVFRMKQATNAQTRDSELAKFTEGFPINSVIKKGKR